MVEYPSIVPTPTITPNKPVPAPHHTHSRTHRMGEDTGYDSLPQGFGTHLPQGLGVPYLTAPWGQKMLFLVYQSYTG